MTKSYPRHSGDRRDGRGLLTGWMRDPVPGVRLAGGGLLKTVVIVGNGERNRLRLHALRPSNFLTNPLRMADLDDEKVEAPPLRPPLANTLSPSEKEPDDLEKIRKWQEERIARKLRGEYESSVMHLTEIVRVSRITEGCGTLNQSRLARSRITLPLLYASRQCA